MPITNTDRKFKLYYNSNSGGTPFFVPSEQLFTFGESGFGISSIVVTDPVDFVLGSGINISWTPDFIKVDKNNLTQITIQIPDCSGVVRSNNKLVGDTGPYYAIDETLSSQNLSFRNGGNNNTADLDLTGDRYWIGLNNTIRSTIKDPNGVVINKLITVGYALNYQTNGNFTLELRTFLDRNLVPNFNNPSFSMVCTLSLKAYAMDFTTIIGSMYETSFTLVPTNPSAVINNYVSTKTNDPSITFSTTLSSSYDQINNIKLVVNDISEYDFIPSKITSSQSLNYSFVSAGEKIKLSYVPSYGRDIYTRDFPKLETSSVRCVRGHKYCISDTHVYFKENSGTYNDITQNITGENDTNFIIPTSSSFWIKVECIFSHENDGFEWGDKTIDNLPTIENIYLGVISKDNFLSLKDTFDNGLVGFNNANLETLGSNFYNKKQPQYGVKQGDSDIFWSYPNVESKTAEFLSNLMDYRSTTAVGSVVDYTASIETQITTVGKYLVFLSCYDEFDNYSIFCMTNGQDNFNIPLI